MSNLAQNMSVRPSEKRLAPLAKRRTHRVTRVERMRALLDEARELCGHEPGYWQELGLTLGVLEHLHNLVTDVAGAHVERTVSPLLAAYALHEAHHTAHSLMLRAVKSAVTASDASDQAAE